MSPYLWTSESCDAKTSNSPWIRYLVAQECARIVTTIVIGFPFKGSETSVQLPLLDAGQAQKTEYPIKEMKPWNVERCSQCFPLGLNYRQTCYFLMTLVKFKSAYEHLSFLVFSGKEIAQPLNMSQRPDCFVQHLRIHGLWLHTTLCKIPSVSVDLPFHEPNLNNIHVKYNLESEETNR